jgi:alginate O-acetyltransferase complex protein AlgI
LGLFEILIFGVAALLYLLLPGRLRGWALLAGSVIAIYWLQPPLPIRFSDFIFPTATLVLTIAAWWFSRRPDDPAQQATRPEDRRTVLLILGLVLLLALNRYLEADLRLTASRPPNPLFLFIGLAISTLFFAGLAWFARRREWRQAQTWFIFIILILFVILKTEPLATFFATRWRGLVGQDMTLAGVIDLNWLGFSYVAFRLIHTLRDRQSGILPVLSLREYVTYVIFFPSFIAGPIDRAERFTGDFRALPALVRGDPSRFTLAATRIGIGLFKKFVIADTLAQGMALDAVNVQQTTTTAGLWLLLYGYAFRLYFDFGGYTDIAIGIGILFGIKLPENFNRPYLRTNITTFWQSWHITLSDFARFYVFTPLSRQLLRRKPRPSTPLIIFIAHMATMLTIGLWHGVSGHFFIWGVWHGLALFAHKMWSDRTRKWYRDLQARPGPRRAWGVFTWFLTFQYVVIGWVWFVVPDVGLAARTLGRLFGIGW